MNEELSKLRVAIIEVGKNVEDKIIEIKLQEVVKTIIPVPKTKRVTDDHLVNIMQYYELVQELKK